MELRLFEVLVHTPGFERARRFYESTLGLAPRKATASWVGYQTRGTLFALHRLDPGDASYVELTFTTPDLDAALSTLRARGVGVTSRIEVRAWGRVARLGDPEGNAVALVELAQPVPEGRGARLGSVVVHARNLAAMKSFYHHALGLRPLVNDARWIEFDTGAAHLALQPRGRGGVAAPVAVGFRIEDLMTWAEAARSRGLRFATIPHDEDWGLYADALDPDGHEVRFYEPAASPAFAESRFDDEAPRAAAIRKPLTKRSRAASRVAKRPAYRTPRTGERRRPSATTQSVASVRGAGPGRTRQKPKRTGDEKKARVRPALGRERKAARAAQKRRGTEAARTSRARPIKRAGARSRSR